MSKLSHCAYFALALQQIDSSQHEVKQWIERGGSSSILFLVQYIQSLNSLSNRHHEQWLVKTEI